MLGSSKATNVACLAVFDPDTNSALSRQLEIRIFVFKSTSASEWLIYLVKDGAFYSFEIYRVLV